MPPMPPQAPVPQAPLNPIVEQMLAQMQAQ
jgi:hypothetical protein